jgi:hypothetical protein
MWTRGRMRWSQQNTSVNGIKCHPINNDKRVMTLDRTGLKTLHPPLSVTIFFRNWHIRAVLSIRHISNRHQDMTTYFDEVNESHFHDTTFEDHFLLYEDGSSPIGERYTAIFVKLCGDDCTRHRFESLRCRRISWRLHEWYGSDGRLCYIELYPPALYRDGPSAWWDYDRLRQFIDQRRQHYVPC